MDLKSCFESALACGLTTVGEAFNNIYLHAPQIFSYGEMKDEVEELAIEIDKYALAPETLIIEHIEDRGWELYYKSTEDERYGAPSIKEA